MDIIKESGLTGDDFAAASRLVMRSIMSKGRDRKAEQDVEEWERIYHFSKAGALLGNADCMGNLADIYYGGKVPEVQEIADPFGKAVSWWEKSAEAGSGRSATTLGLLHMHKEIPGAGSHGVLEYDEVKALEYFKQGFENGDMKAGRHVGLFYQNGTGTEKNPEKAFEWFCKAAERGDSSSALFIADCYLKGEGVAQDAEEAIRRYKALVECKGHDETTAAYALGCIYRDGEYTDKDLDLARTYFESVVRTATRRELHLKEAAEAALTDMYMPAVN